MHKKIDLSNVTSKCGSKDNIHHKPGKFTHQLLLYVKVLKNEKCKCFQKDLLGMCVLVAVLGNFFFFDFFFFYFRFGEVWC